MEAKISALITYHSQSDDQSERINQTIEIALRYLIERKSDTEFLKFLLILKRGFNNSKNIIIGKSPNEIIYEMNLSDSFGVVIDKEVKDFEQLRKIY